MVWRRIMCCIWRRTAGWRCEVDEVNEIEEIKEVEEKG